jgi:hypothetical protein
MLVVFENYMGLINVPCQQNAQLWNVEVHGICSNCALKGKGSTYCFRPVQTGSWENIRLDSGGWNPIWLQLCIHPDGNHSFLGGILNFPSQVEW